MIQDIQTIEIQEKDLELVVSEKTLGSLTTNAKQIKALLNPFTHNTILQTTTKAISMLLKG